MKLDWNDLRYFLAVIAHGSTKRAAAALKVDQTTCARRIGALEAALGLELFNRDEGRYRPTEDALGLVPAAKKMEDAAGKFRELADVRKRRRSSRLRVTCEEAMASAFIIPAVARFTGLHPDIHVEIDVTTDLRDVAAGEADIAVRGGLEPTDPTLVRRKLGGDPVGIYCSPDYPSPPVSADQLRGHPIACFDVLVERLEAAGLGPQIRHVGNNAGAIRTIISGGKVVGPLPRSVAEAEPPLHLCFTFPHPIAIWMIYPEGLRGLPAVKVLGRLLAEEFRRARKDGRLG